MPLAVIAFWVLAAVSALGLLFDFYALRIASARRPVIAALTIKALAVFAFAGWWLYFRVIAEGSVQGFEDLGSLAGLMLLSIVGLSAALGCELVAWARVRKVLRPQI